MDPQPVTVAAVNRGLARIGQSVDTDEVDTDEVDTDEEDQ